MCLKEVTRRYLFARRELKIGYKVLEVTGYGYKATIRGDRYYNYHWFNSSDGRIVADDLKKYRLGFHILENLDDAKEWLKTGYGNGELDGRVYKIFKVQYKNVVARGFQDNCTIVVAKKMYILNSVEI